MKNINKLFATVFASSILVSPLSVLAMSKNETVYSNLNAYGNVSKTTVTNHLSYVGSKDVQDETYLTDILNVNGDEDFNLKGNSLTWKGNGEDIFYQGITSKEVPIKTDIKYYLDGKETPVENIIGKSGKIKINIKLTNTEKNIVKVNGKKKTLYTPYVSTVGMVLGETAKNVQVSNGKVVETGSRSVVVGIAAPGLYDSLKLDDLYDLDRVTINFTTSKFEFSDIYIVSSPKLLQEIDTEVFDKLDELTDSIDKLQKNMDKIEDGSNKVAKGSEKLVSTIKKEKDSKANVLSNKQIADIENQSVESAKQGIKEKFNDEYKNEIGSTAASQAVQSIRSNDTYISSKNAVDLIDAVASTANQYGAIPDSSATTFITAFKTNPTAFDPIIGAMNAVNPAVTAENVTAAANNYATAKQVIVLMETVAKNVAYSVAINSAESAATKTAETVAKSVSGTVAQNVAIQVKSNVLNTLYGDDKNAGINELNKGIQTLNEGIQDYNKKGICVLSKYAEKIDNYSSTAEALVNLSKKYNGYGSNNAKETTFISVVKNK